MRDRRPTQVSISAGRFAARRTSAPLLYIGHADMNLSRTKPNPLAQGHGWHAARIPPVQARVRPLARSDGVGVFLQSQRDSVGSLRQVLAGEWKNGAEIIRARVSREQSAAKSSGTSNSTAVRSASRRCCSISSSSLEHDWRGRRRLVRFKHQKCLLVGSSWPSASLMSLLRTMD